MNTHFVREYDTIATSLKDFSDLVENAGYGVSTSMTYRNQVLSMIDAIGSTLLLMKMIEEEYQG